MGFRASRRWLTALLSAAMLLAQVPASLLPSLLPALARAADGPDLIVSSFTAPATISSGGRASYTWSITNQGTLTATAVLPPSPGPFVWGDQAWLSTSPTSIAGAFPAGGLLAKNSLGPGESYTQTFAATIPAVSPGQYFFILQTDAGNDIAETDESNNLSVAVPVTVTAAFIVNTAADHNDGSCDANDCTLREAITAANQQSGLDTIVFNIPPTATSIQPTSALPAITDALTIDGTTRSGGSVVLDGASAGAGVTGLSITATGSTVRGLVVRNFTINGIFVSANGTTISGDQLSGNAAAGLSFSADNMTITGNTISGNLGVGVLGSGSNNTFTNDTVELNRNDGIFLGFPNSTTNNNTFDGNTVRNNGGSGFVLRGPNGQTNEITQGNTILRGSITGNAAKGISLAFGANGGVLPPAITGITIGAAFTVSGTATPNAAIQIYADAADEGSIFLGSTTASDGDGSWSSSTWTIPDMTAIATAVKAGALRLHATQTTIGGTSEFSAAGSAGISGVATCDGQTLLFGATVDLYSGTLRVATTTATTDTAVYLFRGVAPNATYRIHISLFIDNFDGGGFLVECDATTTTDGAGGSTVSGGVNVPNNHNHTWPGALAITAGTPVTDYVFQQGQSTWFKIPVTRGQRVTVKLTNVPADYSLALYKDIGKLYAAELAALAGTDKLGAVSLHDAAVSPDALSPDELSPDELSPDALSPDALSPDALSPDELSPDELSPDELSPDELSPDALSPDELSPDELSPDELSPDELSAAYTGAQTAALIGVSAHVGLSPEQIARNTWDNTGFFYMRVRGHNGVYDGSLPFTLQATIDDVSCAGAGALVDYPQSPVVANTGAVTLILTNSARLTGGDAGTFMAKLGTFAGRPEVKGVVADLGAMPSFTAAYAQWDANQSCPSAANILAHSIKDVINAYATANPTMRYIVLAGNDGVIPFFRQPDQSGLGSEKDYFPAVKDPTASQASLRLGYVLTQDFYGSLRPVSRFDHELYLPDLAVGRLVETIPQMAAVIDAYTLTNGAVSPTSALVTGYDFLSDTGLFIAGQLQANALTVDKSLVQPIGDSSTSPTAWTANQLAGKLFGPTSYGILSLNAHFSGNTMLAADFATRLRTSDVNALPASDTRFRNALILSTGCHSGYSIVDGANTALTDPMDWAQTFAARGATIIGGTGYQYGDTDFMKYSEQILGNTTLELRYGTGAIPIGVALANAKRAYLASLSSLGGIDEKALAEASLYGLPMLGYALPAGSRLVRPAEGTVGALTPGTSAGLSVASVTPTYTLHQNTRSLSVVGGGSVSALCYDIDGNVAVKPGAPVLPEFTIDATKPGTLMRGAVLLSASYADQQGVTPFTDVASTEVRGVHPRYTTDVFTPVRPFSLNQLAGSHLVGTPFQFRSTAGGTTGTARTLTPESFRLYYSDLTDARALAAAPAVTSVSLTPDGAGHVNVIAIVSGLTTVGVEDVFATYTGENGSLHGAWASTPLALLSTVSNATDATHPVSVFAKTYTGTIALGSTDPNDLRVLIQAAGGNGLVTWASNDGAYYRIPNESATSADPKVATSVALTAPTSATYRSTIQVSATLTTSTGAPLAGKPVAFRSNGLRVNALTGANGVASAPLFVTAAPGTSSVSVGFAEDDKYLGSGASAPLLVTKAPSAFVAADTTVLSGGSVLVATLLGAGQPLGGQLVTLTGAGRTVQTFTDGFGRVRIDSLDGFPSGGFSVTVTYAGNDRYLPASSLSISVPNSFVTAGGWILTPSDALHLVPGKKANFSLNSRYKTGDTVPTGSFDFQAKESNVTFKATAFDSMSIVGTVAEVQGRGTVNGTGVWYFRVRVTADAPETFTVTIWNDSGSFTSPYYRAANALGGGNVVVH